MGLSPKCDTCGSPIPECDCPALPPSREEWETMKTERDRYKSALEKILGNQFAPCPSDHFEKWPSCNQCIARIALGPQHV